MGRVFQSIFRPSPPPPVVIPPPPTPISASPAAEPTVKAMDTAEAEARKQGRGRAATIFTGASGDLSEPSVSKRVLLGG